MEGDDDELETFLRLLEDVQSVHVVSSYFAHVLTCHGVYFTQRLQLCGMHLFEGGVYSRKHSDFCGKCCVSYKSVTLFLLFVFKASLALSCGMLECNLFQI